jgi:hypothetical protein
MSDLVMLYSPIAYRMVEWLMAMEPSPLTFEHLHTSPSLYPVDVDPK